MFMLRISELICESMLAAICRCIGRVSFMRSALMVSIIPMRVCIESIMAAPIIPSIPLPLIPAIPLAPSARADESVAVRWSPPEG